MCLCYCWVSFFFGMQCTSSLHLRVDHDGILEQLHNLAGEQVVGVAAHLAGDAAREEAVCAGSKPGGS